MLKKKFSSLSFLFLIMLLFNFLLLSCQTSLWKEMPPSNIDAPIVSVTKTDKTEQEDFGYPKEDVVFTEEQEATAAAAEEEENNNTENSNDAIQEKSELNNTANAKKKKKDKKENSIFSKKKKTKQPVYYSGDVFIREKKYHRYFGKEVQVLTIKGSVRVRQGATILFAPRVEILGENNEIVLASSGVKIIDHNTTIRAKYGEYHRSDKKVFLKKNCKITHKRKNGVKISIDSNELQHSFIENKSYASSNVRISALPYTARSNEAIYDQRKDLFTLTKKPYVYHENTVYHAEKILLFREKENIEMNEDVSIWHTEDEQTNKDGNKQNRTNQDKKTVISLITSQKASRTKMQNGNFKTEFFSESSNNQVRLTREDIFFYTDYAVLYGKKQLEATGNIRLIDREKNHRIFAESGRFSADGKVIQFFSVAKGNNIVLPIAILVDEKKKASTFLLANHMEKNDLIKKIISRGNIGLEFLKKNERKVHEFNRQTIEKEKREGSVFLGGELAEMPNSENKIYLTGRPYVLQAEEKIFAREIIVDNDKHKLQLKGSLQGRQQIR